MKRAFTKRALKFALALPVMIALAAPLSASGRNGSVWARTASPQVNAPGADVFLVDDDLGNQVGYQCVDYEGYYANALQVLGLTHTDWETGVDGTPPWLMHQQAPQVTQDTPVSYYVPYGLATANRMVIDFSGVTRCGRAMGWNVAALQSYLNGGGRMLVFSQDALYYDNLYTTTSLSGTASFAPARYFGAQYVADVTTVPSVIGDAASPYLSGFNYNLGAPKSSIDRMQVASYAGGDSAVTLKNGGNTSQVLGTRMSSEPTIERVKSGWQPLPYRTEILSFGLENLPDDTARAVLLDRLVSFLLDDVSVSFTGTPLVACANTPATLHAAATMSITQTKFGFANAIVSYRWDFGDGSPIVTSAGPSVNHTYAQTGIYKAYVEVMDKFGHKAVKSADVSVGGITNATIMPALGGTLTVYLDPTSYFSVYIPPGAFSGSTSVNVTAGITGSLAPSGTLKFLGNSFFIQSTGTLVHPATLTIVYPGDAEGLVAPLLRVYHWQEPSGPWTPLAGTVDLARHQLTVQLDHFSRYSVQGPVAKRIYLPQLRKAS